MSRDFFIKVEIRNPLSLLAHSFTVTPCHKAKLTFRIPYTIMYITGVRIKEVQDESIATDFRSRI